MLSRTTASQSGRELPLAMANDHLEYHTYSHNQQHEDGSQISTIPIVSVEYIQKEHARQ
jgi:hypothetical protein